MPIETSMNSSAYQVVLSTVKDVSSGKVDIDLSIMGMIKIKKQLDLCSVLGSDVMGHKDCPLQAGDLNLDATGKRLYLISVTNMIKKAHSSYIFSLDS
jgi:hypothetical protein